MTQKVDFGKANMIGILCLSVTFFSVFQGPVFGAIRAKFIPRQYSRVVHLRGVEAIHLDQSQATASTEFALSTQSHGSLWIHVFFPWINKQTVRVTLNGRDRFVVTGMNQGGLWNSGNIDVWHWVRFYEGSLSAGTHTVVVDASGGVGAAVESIIWTGSQTPWTEDWLFGPELARKITNSTPLSVSPRADASGKSMIIEAEMGICKAESLGETTVRLDLDSDYLAVPFRLTEPFKGSLWVRIFLGWKNNYEGWTLDELANVAHLFLDGELKKTVWGEDGYHWRWYKIGDVELNPGLHLFTLRKTGSYVVIDSLALYCGQNFTKEPFFRVGPAVEPSRDPFFSNAGYPEYGGPMRIVARYPLGFGVPGYGYPRFFGENLLVLPGGEGAISVVNISNAHQAEIYDYCLTWYFNRAVFPFRDGFYVNSLHRGVYFVEGVVEKNQPIRFRWVDMDCVRYGRLGAVFPDADPFPLAVTLGGTEGAAIMDISQPLYPVVLGVVKNYRGNDFLLSQDGQSGATIDKDGTLGIIDLSEPQEAVHKPLFHVPSEMSKEKKRFAHLIGLSRNYIFLRLGSKVHVLRRKDVANAGPFGIIDLGKKPGGFVRAYEYEGFIHIIDGAKGPGQYSIGYKSRHSIWRVFRPEDLSKPVFEYTDPYPTAYSFTIFRSGKAYVFDYNYGLWIFDLSNLERPTKLGGISTAGEGHYLHILENGILCMSQTFGGTLTIMDVRNPLDPKKVGQFWDGSWFSYDTASHTDLMTGKGTVLYLPKPKGIQIIDFGKPADPKVIGFIEGRKCRVVGERLYTIIGKELLLYDVSNERNPLLTGRLDTGQTNMSMAMDHPNTVWLAGKSNIVAVDVSDTKRPKIVGRWEDSKKNKFWGGISYYKGYLFGAYGEDSRAREIATIDVHNPASMRLFSAKVWQPRGLYSPANDSWANFYRGDSLVHGEYLLAGNYSRVELYDLSDPLDPKPVQMLNTGCQWSVGKIRDGYLFVPTLSGLVVVKLWKE